MFFESIKLLDGKLYNLKYHQTRIENTRKTFFPSSKDLDLDDLYELAKAYTNGLFKARVTYADQISKIEVEPYQLKEIKRVRMVEIEDFEYLYKSTDRTFFNEKLKKQAGFDDILMINEGFITDTSYCNISLYDGEQWYTPKSYLLPGTKRAALIEKGIIQEKEIRQKDISSFYKIVFLNAMRDFEMIHEFTIFNDILILKPASIIQ